MDFETATTGAKAWKDIWGCGQGIGAVTEIDPAAVLVDRLAREYARGAAETERSEDLPQPADRPERFFQFCETDGLKSRRFAGISALTHRFRSIAERCWPL